jgi:hypothetical protein
MDAINRGRAAIGLDPIEKLEFDECDVTNSNCLSARHLFAADDDNARVWSDTVRADERIAEALGMEVIGRRNAANGQEYAIPEEILRVTAVFDALGRSEDDRQKLRDRMVEAGVVD